MKQRLPAKQPEADRNKPAAPQTTQETAVPAPQPLVIQPSLRLGPADDPYERQADAVATAVSGGNVSPQAYGPVLNRRPTSADAHISPELDSAVRQAQSGGQPLPLTARQPVEQALGADFSGVRIHHDAESDRLNQALQANAFTTGQHIFFRRATATGIDNTLLAHELVHVAQQKHPVVQASPRRNSVAQNDHPPTFREAWVPKVPIPGTPQYSARESLEIIGVIKEDIIHRLNLAIRVTKDATPSTPYAGGIMGELSEDARKKLEETKTVISESEKVINNALQVFENAAGNLDPASFLDAATIQDENDAIIKAHREVFKQHEEVNQLLRELSKDLFRNAENASPEMKQKTLKSANELRTIANKKILNARLTTTKEDRIDSSVDLLETTVEVTDITAGILGAGALIDDAINTLLDQIFGGLGISLGATLGVALHAERFRRAGNAVTNLKNLKENTSNEDLKKISDYAIAQKNLRKKRLFGMGSLGVLGIVGGVLAVATLGTGSLVAGGLALVVGSGVIGYRQWRKRKKRRIEREKVAREIVVKAMSSNDPVEKSEARYILSESGIDPNLPQDKQVSILGRKLKKEMQSERERRAHELVHMVALGDPQTRQEAISILKALRLDADKIREQALGTKYGKAVSEVMSAFKTW